MPVPHKSQMFDYKQAGCLFHKSQMFDYKQAGCLFHKSQMFDYKQAGYLFHTNARCLITNRQDTCSTQMPDKYGDRLLSMEKI
jgi:hypothetical protein